MSHKAYDLLQSSAARSHKQWVTIYFGIVFRAIFWDFFFWQRFHIVIPWQAQHFDTFSCTFCGRRSTL